MPEIASPHSDLELGTARAPLRYELALPSAGIGPRTGVLFYIHGLAGSFDDAYARKLLPYWADLYDCATVAVDYFGSAGFSRFTLRPAPDFFLRLREHHGVGVQVPAGADMDEVVRHVIDAMATQGVRQLHQSCVLVRQFPGYMSFGLLPALDHLQVLHELLLRYPLDKRRIFALGTSYGGTIALLMAKYAPNTFRLVVENSCYSGPRDDIGLVYGISAATHKGMVYLSHAQAAFSPDRFSQAYFSTAREMIRDLAVREHYTQPSDTVLHSYHCVEDETAPTANKLRVADAMRGLRRHELTLVDRDGIDGTVFKSMGHAMQASLRGVFARSYQRWLPGADAAPAITDFELGTVNRLDCGGQSYVFEYGPAFGVRLSIV